MMINEQLNEAITQYWHCPNCQSTLTSVYNSAKKNRPVKTFPTVVKMQYELVENLGNGDVCIDELKGKCCKCDQIVQFVKGGL